MRFMPQVLKLPAKTVVKSKALTTGTGTLLLETVLLPSCPSLLNPQQYVPFEVMPQVLPFLLGEKVFGLAKTSFILPVPMAEKPKRVKFLSTNQANTKALLKRKAKNTTQG